MRKFNEISYAFIFLFSLFFVLIPILWSNKEIQSITIEENLIIRNIQQTIENKYNETRNKIEKEVEAITTQVHDNIKDAEEKITHVQENFVNKTEEIKELVKQNLANKTDEIKDLAKDKAKEALKSGFDSLYK